MRFQLISFLRLAFPAILLNLVFIATGQAQKSDATTIAITPPCGVAAVKPIKGERKQQRFFAATPERVKEALLDALLAVGAEVKKDKGNAMEARRSAKHADYNGGNGEKLLISWELGEDGGVKGILLKFETKRNKFIGSVGQKNWTEAVLDEVTCLVNLLSPIDPRQQSQNIISGDEQRRAGREIVLPADTQINVRLRHYFSTERVKAGESIIFEAAEDVTSNGEIVVKKGSLCLGKISSINNPKSYGREAEMEFHIETIMAADGQRVRLREEPEPVGQSNRKQVIGTIIGVGPIFGALVKGQHVGVRAGTQFSTFVDGNWTIKIGN